MAYNPVTNPNPEGNRVRTGVMSQGFDGNIVNCEDTDLEPNIRYQTGLPFGEDSIQDGSDAYE